MDSDLTKITIVEALKALREKKISSVELAKAHIEKIEKYRSLNAYITETPEAALKEAEKSDERYRKNEARSLEGIPIGIKDLFCTEGVRTTSGSKMLENFVPIYESTVSSNIRGKGAVSLGKLNMDEFAMGSSNKTSYFGQVINPWKANGSSSNLSPGGSSGGSGASVASFTSMAALGSDTGGSVRQPASFTGTVGMKPTYGRCSRYGMIAFASSLDQAGILARNVGDAALALEAMMGFDPKDSTSLDLEAPDLKPALSQSVKGLKIGVPVDLMKRDGISSEIISIWNENIEKLKKEGAEIKEVTLPNSKYALPAYYVIAPAEASSNLARYDGVRYGHRTEKKFADINEMYESTRSEAFGEEVKRRILIGTYVLSSSFMEAYYLKAQKIRRIISGDFAAAFSETDLILLPSGTGEAFSLEETPKDPATMYLNDIFTIPASLAGLPAISVPAGLSKNGLPLGMQLVGRAFDEYSVIRGAAAIERVNSDLNFIPGGY